MNIIVCCDGTDNQFSAVQTNVVRLVKSLDRDPTKQHLYYDPGVGTLPEPNKVTQFGKSLSKLWQQMLGIGVMRNAAEAYTYLMNNWEPGANVYLFGFSRGAYTVRVLAGWLHMLGLLPKGNENLIPYAIRRYKSIRETTREDAPKEWDLCDDFRRTFSRSTGLDRHFPIHFLGLWDTVSSIGWFWEPKSYPYTRHNPSIARIWHAVSIDEHRAFFRTNLMSKDKNAPAQELHERWFPGDHSDIGGGHAPVMGGLWRCSFEWILGGAFDAGLLVDIPKLKEVLAKPPANPWAEDVHDLLVGKWKLAEYLPKKHWNYLTEQWERRCNRFEHRSVHHKAVIDQSVLDRLRDGSLAYRPSNLSDQFIQWVTKMSAVTQALAYEYKIPPDPSPIGSQLKNPPLFPLP